MLRFIFFSNLSLSGSGEATVKPVQCPTGYYCPPGLTVGWEFPCPPGTVQNQLGVSAPESCLPCPAGKKSCSLDLYVLIKCASFFAILGCDFLVCHVGSYCSQPGLSEPTGLCEAGYYCLAGSARPNIREDQVLLLSVYFVYQSEQEVFAEDLENTKTFKSSL